MKLLLGLAWMAVSIEVLLWAGQETPALPSALPVPQEGAELPGQADSSRPGRIRGIVRIESKIQSKSVAFNLYSRRGGSRSPSTPPPALNELENVVVYLEGIRSDPPKPMSSPTVQQVNETFVPHVLPITAGTTVHFPNGDPFFHNVFSLSSAKSFDLGRYPRNQSRSAKFDRPGIVKVFCHIHSHMSAVILVFDHPYFCVPDAHGSFTLEDVPPGHYQLVAWHERLKPKKQPVTVAAHTELALDLVL